VAAGLLRRRRFVVPLGFVAVAEHVRAVVEFVRQPGWVWRDRAGGVERQLRDAMKQLLIVVKPFRAEAVLRAVADLGVGACVVREAKGYGRQKGYLDRYRGGEFATAYLPKVEITVWVDDEQYDAVAGAVARAARTGRIGDGKVFVVPTAWPGSLDF
jgi:nitrogen regulatory protein PII